MELSTSCCAHEPCHPCFSGPRSPLILVSLAHSCCCTASKPTFKLTESLQEATQSKNITITWDLISFSPLINGKSPGAVLSWYPDHTHITCTSQPPAWSFSRKEGRAAFRELLVSPQMPHIYNYTTQRASVIQKSDGAIFSATTCVTSDFGCFMTTPLGLA